MKRAEIHNRESVELPIAWREAEFAALRAEAEDTGDDRVGESMFDIEDERAEVETIVNGINHLAN